jgi:hypothetical protein
MNMNKPLAPLGGMTRPFSVSDVYIKPVREVSSLIASASEYHNEAHVIRPAAWKGEYVIAVLDKRRDGMKIAHIAVKFDSWQDS